MSCKVVRNKNGNNEILTVLVDVKTPNITNEIKINRLPTEAEAGRIESGRANVEATNLLRRIREENKEVERNSPEDQRIQTEALKQFAKENDYWFEEDFNYGTAIGAGTESVIYAPASRPSEVIKVTNPHSMNFSPLEYLDRIAIHNSLFPETRITIEGFSEDYIGERGRKGDLRIITSQPRINFDEENPLNFREIEDFLTQRGFEIINDYMYKNDTYVLEDTHNENIVRDTEGNIFVLDVNYLLNTPDQNFGGTQTFGQLEEFSPTQEITVTTLQGDTTTVNSNNITTYQTEVGDLNYIEDSEGNLIMVKTLETRIDLNTNSTFKLDGISDNVRQLSETMSDKQIEDKITELDNGLDPDNLSFEYEKIMQEREWNSVLGRPLSEANSALDRLQDKEDNMPNGYGAFIESFDMIESRDIIEKYNNPNLLTTEELFSDFISGIRGNPTSTYSDGLKVRESMMELLNREYKPQDFIDRISDVYTKDGYDNQTGLEMAAKYLSIFSNSTIQEPTYQTESQTYKQLLSLPEVTQEEALEMYKHLYNEDMVDWENSNLNCN